MMSGGAGRNFLAKMFAWKYLESLWDEVSRQKKRKSGEMEKIEKDS